LNNIELNSITLQKELMWLAQVIDTRMKLYFGQECSFSDIYEVPCPDLTHDSSVYAQVIKHFRMNMQERLVVLLTLAPHVYPQLLDPFFIKNETYSRGFTEFGGIKGNQHSGFLPTGETACFLLAANDITERLKLIRVFQPDHFFSQQKILYLDRERSSEPFLCGALTMGKEYLSYLSTGDHYKPVFNSEFPAKVLTTNLEWDDLVLDDFIIEDIQEIINWIKYQHILIQDWGLGKVLKPGYRSLFYGPPGTGKTLSASLLGKTTGLEVYRIDLSQVVSKYIGETEKNMANIFDQAENKNWILFFDEADALFGKRTANSDSKDRYANQEVAYLLQRIEDFPGVIILATNLKANIDEAFARRFQSMIFFPMPRPEQRLKLWQNAFVNSKLDKKIDMREIARKYELSGGAIINVLRSCVLAAVTRKEPIILQDDLVESIRREFKKEGKTVF
jgi:hypothetical protein